MAVDRSKYLDVQEIEAMSNEAERKGLRDLKRGRISGVLMWMVVDLALGTGLRVGELASLKVEDIDFKQGSISVLREKRRRRRKRKRIMVTNQAKKPIRETLAVDPELMRHLKEFVEWRCVRITNMSKSKIEGVGEDRGSLFVGQRGPMTVQGLQQAWKTVASKAKVTRTNSRGNKVPKSIHVARHTMGVMLLKRTGNLYQVQRQLGHASPATTSKFYCDIDFETMREGVTGLFKTRKRK